jgi:tRNA nucleotidyltransferase/poly(A) polymerase
VAGYRVNTEEQVLAWLAQQDIPAYLVGGCVRDRRLNRPIYDLDLAVAGDGLALARRLANHFQGAYYPLDEARSTGRVILPGEAEHRLVVDVARFRGPDLAADLADRDFTINALAADVRTPGDVIDHHSGLADLATGLIRPVSDASIRTDPLRALRAVRLAAQLGFALAPETEALIRRDGAALARVSGERIRDEFARLLALSQAAPRLQQLDDLDLLTIILPELEPLRGLAQPPPHYLDALVHSLETVSALEALLDSLFHDWGSEKRDKEPRPNDGGWGMPTTQHPISNTLLEVLSPYAGRLQAHLDQRLGEARPRLVTLKLAAVLHDTGKPAAHMVDKEGRIRFIGHHQDGARIAGTAMRRLRFNRTEVRVGATIVRHHMRPLLLANEQGVSSRAIYRFFRDTGDSGVDVLLYALADHRATYAPGEEDERWLRLAALTARMLADYWERQAERVAPPPFINGHDLLHEFGLQPGPHIGELLEAVREAQVSGEVRTREQALALVRSRLAR